MPAENPDFRFFSGQRLIDKNDFAIQARDAMALMIEGFNFDDRIHLGLNQRFPWPRLRETAASGGRWIFPVQPVPVHIRPGKHLA